MLNYPTGRCITKVPDPFLGPKGIRLLLAFRGFSGCVVLFIAIESVPTAPHRFVGLFGLYSSLQYLSLSDATVLTFLTPFTTAIAGALILKETSTRKEAFAGCESRLLVTSSVVC
jgi:drug/metabolite transporter (DMT)-like permease